MIHPFRYYMNDPTNGKIVHRIKSFDYQPEFCFKLGFAFIS